MQESVKIEDTYDTIEECICDLIKQLKTIVPETETILKYNMEVFRLLKHEYDYNDLIEPQDIGEFKVATITKDKQFKDYSIKILGIREEFKGQTFVYYAKREVK